MNMGAGGTSSNLGGQIAGLTTTGENGKYGVAAPMCPGRSIHQQDRDAPVARIGGVIGHQQFARGDALDPLEPAFGNAPAQQFLPRCFGPPAR